MIKREKPIVSSFSNLITSFFTLGVTLIIGIIITRALGPKLKGEFLNLKLIATFYAPFLLIGYQGGVLFYILKKKIEIKQFFWIGWLVTGVIAIIAICLFIPLTRYGYLGSVAASSEYQNILLGLSVIPLTLLNSYCNRVINSQHLFRAANMKIIAGSIVTLVYYLVLVTFYKISLSHAIIGLILGQSVQLIMNLYFVIKYVEVKWTLDFKQMFKPFNYGTKIWFNQLIAKSNDKFDITILTFLLNASSLGIYATGVGLSNLVTTIPSSYMNVFFNQIAEKNTTESLELYAKAQRITFIITLILAILLSLFSFPLVYLFYGNAFIAATWVIIFYTPGLIFQVAARLSIKFYAAQGRPLKNSLVYVFGLIISLPFYFLLIPKYGIRGAAIASSIAYFSAFMFSFFQIHREYGLSAKEILKFRKEDIIYVRSLVYKLPIVNKIFKK